MEVVSSENFKTIGRRFLFSILFFSVFDDFVMDAAILISTKENKRVRVTDRVYTRSAKKIRSMALLTAPESIWQ